MHDSFGIQLVYMVEIRVPTKLTWFAIFIRRLERFFSEMVSFTENTILILIEYRQANLNWFDCIRIHRIF